MLNCELKTAAGVSGWQSSFKDCLPKKHNDRGANKKTEEHTKNRNKKGNTQFKNYSFNIFSAGETMRKYNTQWMSYVGDELGQLRMKIYKPV